MSPPTDSSSVPSDDPLIRGVLEVHSPSDRTISGIEIKLKALQSVALIDSGMHTGTEESVVFEKIINLGLEAPESCGSLSNQTRSPSPTNRSSIPSNDLNSAQVIGRPSIERRGSISPQTSRPSSIRRRSTIDSDGTNSGIFLSKGVHGFEFSILLPSSSPPYERSTFGRVIWILSATAFGGGRAKGNISTERPIYPVVNPNPDGGPVILSTGYHDLSSVGLLACDFSSDNLCVGGALSIEVRSPEPSKGIKIHLVKVSIESSVELETKKQGINQIPKRSKVLFIKGYVPPQNPKDVGQGDKQEGIVYDDSKVASEGKKEWAVGAFVRLPDDNVIRPTTLPGSSSAIRWSHNLLLQIVYSFPNSENNDSDSGISTSNSTPKLKIFSVRNKISVPSCCASHDAVRLPQYQASALPTSLPLNSMESNASSPPPLLPDSPWSLGSTVLWGPRHDSCICGQTLADLERSIIPRRRNSEIFVDSVRQSKIEECSCPDSPTYQASTNNPTSSFSSSAFSPLPTNFNESSNITSINLNRRSSSSVLGSGLTSSPSRTVSVDESFGIPSLELNPPNPSFGQRSRSLGCVSRQRSVEFDGDPPTYDCAMEEDERGRN